jgi:hypothetical protein
LDRRLGKGLEQAVVRRNESHDTSLVRMMLGYRSGRKVVNGVEEGLFNNKEKAKKSEI